MSEEIRLIDIIDEFISGDWGEESSSSECSCAVSCVRGADIVPITNNRYENIPIRFISSSSLKNRELKEGDIIIEKSGGSPTQSTGRTVFVSNRLINEKKYVVCSNFCQAFRLKQEWNPLYVYYFLQVVYNAGVFFNYEGKTSGLRNLILSSAFQAIKLKKISLAEQDRVVKTISLIDDKIATNYTIKDDLFAMTHLLYDYWFVQFDFPDANGRPYKSSGNAMIYNKELKREIPAGWEKATLLDIANYTNGLACQNYRPKQGEAQLPVIKIKEMRDGFTSDSEVVSISIPESIKVHNGDILFSWSASLEVMQWAYGEGGLNQHIFKVTGKDGYPKGFYYFQILNYVDVFRKIAEARKTTMGHITQDHLKQSKIAVPKDKAILEKFESLVKPLMDKQVTLTEEITSLNRMRDFLLPMLMTGQLSIN